MRPGWQTMMMLRGRWGQGMAELRREIPALSSVVYMNTGSSGPSPRVAGEAEAAASRRINDDGILVRSLPYPRALRASLHFFNTEEEIEAVLRALRELPR